MEHIRKLPCTGSNITLDRMCQCIHTGCSCQSLWHACHHLRIDKCNDRDIMRIYADHLTILLYIRDNVVDRNLCCGTGCRRYCKDRHTLMLCISNALQAANICKIRILHDNTNALSGIHRRSTTDRNNVISACSLASRNTCLYILDRWVWLNIGI